MKLTWFGSRCFRIHAGGQIAVVEADAAPAGIDRTELLGGADHAVNFGDPPPADAQTWRARPAQRLLDAGTTARPMEIWSVGPEALLIDADGEAPLLLATGELPELGKWAGNAVIVLCGVDLAQRGQVLLEVYSPRLLVLAGSDAAIEAAFEALRDRLDGTGLVALEAGLAIEA